MADWPDADEIALVLNVVDPTSHQVPTFWQTTIDRVRATAIQHVTSTTGFDPDTDDVTDSMAQAALVMAVLLAERPTSTTPTAVSRDPTYLRALTGQRKRFGIA